MANLFLAIRAICVDVPSCDNQLKQTEVDTITHERKKRKNGGRALTLSIWCKLALPVSTCRSLHQVQCSASYPLWKKPDRTPIDRYEQASPPGTFRCDPCHCLSCDLYCTLLWSVVSSPPSRSRIFYVVHVSWKVFPALFVSGASLLYTGKTPNEE